MTSVLVMLLLSLSAPVVTAHSDRDQACPGNIRSTHHWVMTLLCTSASRSTTLGQLVAAVGAAPLVVYIMEARGAPADWDGRIRFIGRAGRWRFVQIDVRRQAFDAEGAALLAHELQHALEVHSGSVDDRTGFDQLFTRIGFRAAGRDAHVFDTVAAVRAGLDTFRELTGQSPRHTASMARTLRAIAPR